MLRGLRSMGQKGAYVLDSNEPCELPLFYCFVNVIFKTSLEVVPFFVVKTTESTSE